MTPATRPKPRRSTPGGPTAVGRHILYGATPDVCSPFGLAVGPQQQMILCSGLSKA